MKVHAPKTGKHNKAKALRAAAKAGVTIGTKRVNKGVLADRARAAALGSAQS